VWTDPRNAIAIADHIRDVLIELDPEGAAAYRANHRQFTAELQRLDAELEAMLTDLRGRRFLVFHPAWGYFADAYGLRQIPIESRGRAPGAAGLTAVIELAREQEIDVILVQEQFSRSEAEAVARAIDGRVITANPLAADYQASLRRVARVLVEELGR
jgi:zinc transport system substrate-binding protein